MPVFAAIDIGANSVRLKIARQQGRKFRVLHEDREVTRLGSDVFESHRLAPEAIARTIKVLRRFHKETQRLHVDAVRVLATSPLREARNAAELVNWARLATGWRIETISGLEEGRLIHRGVLAHHRFHARQLLLVDLGGGSCEITLSRKGRIQHLFTLPLGAVRLTEAFLAHDPPRTAELKRLREVINGELDRLAPLRRAGPRFMVATSGTAAALAAATGARRGWVERDEVARLAKVLARQSARQRARWQGIGMRRCQIIVAGAAVFTALLERGNLSGFFYSPCGLRDGVLAEMAASQAGASTARQRLGHDREAAVLALARHYAVDLRHARRIQNWAFKLFDLLRRYHGLPAAYREWLGAAALLHEVGGYINSSGRWRHAHYIIANSEILGFRPEERQILAVLSRCLGSYQPLPHDRALRPLGAAAQMLPRALVLLRLARGLEQSRRGAVTAIRIRRRPSSAALRLTLSAGRRGAALEQWALEKECGYFRAVFGRALTPAMAEQD